MKIKFCIDSIVYHWSGTCYHYARPLKWSRVWQRTALAFSVLWFISVSVLLLGVAQCSPVVESSRFLFLSQNLGISLGTGRTSMYTDHRRWTAGDMWQRLRLWLRNQVIASGKPRLPHSRLAAGMWNYLLWSCALGLWSWAFSCYEHGHREYRYQVTSNLA